MRSPRAAELAGPPRLWRSVCLQALALAVVAVVAGLRGNGRDPRSNPAPPQPPKPEVRRIRVVQLPRPPPPRSEARPSPPAATARPPAAAPGAARAPAPQKIAPEERTRIAVDAQAVQGIRMRVLVPRTPGDLAAHLRNSGGCMVVSRLTGGSAEVLSVLGLDGGRAVEVSGAPCAGVPRLLRDGGLNAALGDPVGRARASLPGAERGDELALQVLLAPGLHQVAEYALRARFGAIPEDQMARRAAETGYELTCFAEPTGALRCQ
ncbi:MAG: hypothetical protein ACJ79H_16385 [Myxococcales bacterium]